MRLGFVSYLENPREFKTSDIQPAGVTIDGEFWWYEKGQSFEQKFKIGSGVRIPSTGEEGFFFGIAMVVDLDNPRHIRAREHIEAEYTEGVLC